MSTGKFNVGGNPGHSSDIGIARSGSTAKNKFTAADSRRIARLVCKRSAEILRKGSSKPANKPSVSTLT